jgi:hypothetical protein
MKNLHILRSKAKTYTIRDNFDVDLAAGAVSGTSCTPGPGYRNCSAGVSIANGKLVLPGTAQSFWLSKVAGASDIVRVSGQVVRWKYANPLTLGTGYFGVFESSTSKEVIYNLLANGYQDTRVYERVCSYFVNNHTLAYHRNTTPIFYIVLEPDNTRWFASDGFRTDLLWLSIDTPGSGNFRVGSNSVSIDAQLDEFKVWTSKMPVMANTAFFDISNPVTGTEIRSHQCQG